MESPYIADFERTGPIRKRKLLSTGARRNIHDPIHSPIRSLPRWQERESQALRSMRVGNSSMPARRTLFSALGLVVASSLAVPAAVRRSTTHRTPVPLL